MNTRNKIFVWIAIVAIIASIIAPIASGIFSGSETESAQNQGDN